MPVVRITSIYDEIIAYYRTMNYKKLVTDEFAQDKTDAFIVDGESVPIVSPMEAEALFLCDKAYRTYTGDQKENDLEKLRRYLTDYFNYLMKNVLYIDIQKLKKGQTYYVYDKDAPIIKEILLRACSQHARDRIIGKWLRGKIEENSFFEIVELSGRLNELIININGIPTGTDEEQERWKMVKEQWIMALRLALRSDLAYFMTEIEMSAHCIYSSTLPFKVEPRSEINKKASPAKQATEENDDKTAVTKEQYSGQNIELLNPVLNYLNQWESEAQKRILMDIAEYHESVDFDSLQSVDSAPSLELLKLKGVCEYLYGRDELIGLFPQADKIKEYTRYFISIDKEYQEKIKKRRERDLKYHWNKPKKNTVDKAL